MLTYFDRTEIKAALDGLDFIAAEMERKWGIGRLRLLVGDELRARFDRQLTLLDRFLWAEDAILDEVLGKVQAMQRAWQALDAAAAGAGHPQKVAAFLECVLPGGGVIAIVDEHSGADLPADGRRITVYSTDEIGRMVAAAAGILTIKQEFPGAVVDRIRVNRPMVNDNVGDLIF